MPENETVNQAPDEQVPAVADEAPKAAPEALAAPSLEDQLAQFEEKYKRVLAEYDNFRKRSQKERETLYQDACCTAIAAFLPVLDNLERAQAAGADQGVVLIAKQFSEVLEHFGVQPCGEVGEPFDPNLHNAIAHVEDESLKENTICEVLLRGYRMGDRVVRHAMVRVAN